MPDGDVAVQPLFGDGRAIREGHGGAEGPLVVEKEGQEPDETTGSERAEPGHGPRRDRRIDPDDERDQRRRVFGRHGEPGHGPGENEPPQPPVRASLLEGDRERAEKQRCREDVAEVDRREGKGERREPKSNGDQRACPRIEPVCDPPREQQHDRCGKHR